VNLALYGRDFKERTTLAKLVERVLTVDGLGRLRLSSLESIFAGDDLLQLLNHPKFCPHLHIPFQSGDDKVLKAMNKRETVKDYLEFVAKARRINPDVAISADFIAGFPAEGEKEFQNTLDFLLEVKPMRTHLFTFSPREGTPLAGVKMKDKALIKKRFNLLQEAANQCALDYARRFIGRKMEIVTEEKKGAMAFGYTPNYLHVGVNKDLTPGSVISVAIDNVKNGIIHAVPAQYGHNNDH
jgi:threonylcarbamoyladenosine tRNA methylthiotransferase MtaB